MEILEVTKVEIHFVETDNPDFPLFTRYGPDDWTNRMGSSDEPVYETKPLELAFQEHQSGESD